MGAASPTAASLATGDVSAFARCMAAFAPFEDQPHVAVAVSGGGDSMALCLLTQAWAADRGGRVTALTVDHGMRPESAAEARQVGQWLESRGVGHVILRWEGAKPANRRQEAARDARYRLLAEWCRKQGVLHLVLGHTHGDQAETVLMRAARATGAEGLAGMSAVVELRHLRLLRPVLGMTRQSLRIVLRAVGQPWIEDPSNDDGAFARVGARRALDGPGGYEAAAHLVTAAAAAGRVRQTLESVAAATAMRCTRLHPAGFAWLDRTHVQGLPEVVAANVLARLVAVVGGQTQRPRRQAVARVVATLRAAGRWPGATLNGCRMIPATGDDVLVCREGRNLPPPLPVVPCTTVRWDGRFDIDITGDAGRGACRIAPLGRAGWVEVRRRQASHTNVDLPSPVRVGLPALWDEVGVLEVPHMAYRRDGGRAVIGGTRFQPTISLAAAGFRLAPGAGNTM